MVIEIELKEEIWILNEEYTIVEGMHFLIIFQNHTISVDLLTVCFV